MEQALAHAIEEMKKHRRPFQTAHLARVVERRKRIGDALLALWRAFENPDDPSSPARRRPTLALLLLGAAFSLWRGAFLIKDQRSLDQVTTDAREFLGILLADNSIAFAQDRDTGEWTGGYYLNSAFHRLNLLAAHLSLKKNEAGAFRRVTTFIEDQKKPDHVPDLDRGWRVACDALEIGLKHLERR